MFTVEFFVKVAPRGDRQGPNELLELDGAIVVLVKDPEHQRGELRRVTVGEELRVDLDKALLG